MTNSASEKAAPAAPLSPAVNVIWQDVNAKAGVDGDGGGEGHSGCCTSTDTSDAETPSFDANFSETAVVLKLVSPHAAVTAYLA